MQVWGPGALAAAHMARLASSAAVSLVSSTSWQRKVRGIPRNHACRLRGQFYLPAKEVPRQSRQHNQAERECRDCRLAAESGPCSWEGTETFLMGQKPHLQAAFLSGSQDKKQRTAELTTPMRNILDLLTRHRLPFTYFQSRGPGGFLGTILAVGDELLTVPLLSIPAAPSARGRAPGQPARTLSPPHPLTNSGTRTFFAQQPGDTPKTRPYC